MDDKLINNETKAFISGARPSNNEQPIVAMDLPQKKFLDAAHKTYHVYKNSKEFVEVEATTASEAMEKSGIKKPVKIKRSYIDAGTLIEEKLIVDKNPANPEKSASNPAPASGAAETPSPTN